MLARETRNQDDNVLKMLLEPEQHWRYTVVW